MSSALFSVHRHQTPGQHIREYPGAAKHRQEHVFQLDIKQYIPIDNPWPQAGDVTIIAAHGNGFPKVDCLLCLIFARCGAILRPNTGSLRALMG